VFSNMNAGRDFGKFIFVVFLGSILKDSMAKHYYTKLY
jgi:hypothetical protein